jgi:hypothetical protein
MTNLILFPIVVLVGGLLLWPLLRDLLSSFSAVGIRKAAYVGRPVMTDNERVFHATLKSALPDERWELWPQVSMLAFVAPADENARNSKDESRRKRFWSDFGRISQQRVDWIAARDGVAVCVIELDDRTHVAEKDRQRDAIVAAAGLPTLRYQSADKPQAQRIRATLIANFGASSQ